MSDKDKNVNVRLSEQTYQRWEEYYKSHKFSSMSALVRFSVETIIEGDYSQLTQASENPIERKVREYDNEISEVLKQQTKILKLIAEKTLEEKDIDLTGDLKNYQKVLILNLLSEMPRDEEELSKLTEIPEDEVLVILNHFLELGKVKMNDKGKYEVIV